MTLSVLLSLSCKEPRDLRGEPMQAPSKDTPTGFDVDTAKRPQFTQDAGPISTDALLSKRKNHPAFSAKEVAQLATTLPKLENARTLKDLVGVPRSRVAVQTICINEPLGRATTQLVRAYQSKKWSDVVIGRGASKTRKTITANSQHFRMTATVAGDEANVCAETAAHSKVTLRFQERVSGVAKPKGSTQPKLP